MSTRLRTYGIALASVAAIAALRFSLTPLLGNRFGFDFFLIGVFVCGRYLGLGPSIFALLVGAIPVTLVHLVSRDLHDPYFGMGLSAYFALGAIVVALCKSEQDVRTALRQEIDEHKKALQELAAEQGLLRRIIEVQDEERQLISFDIHDGLVQYATGALMRLEATQHELSTEASPPQLEPVVAILRKAVDEGRRVIDGIWTPVLEDCGVVPAVQQLIENEDRAHVHVEFVKDEHLARMARNIQVALFKITQEALANSHKHSQTSRVRIELRRHADRVRLEVRDWGVGFAPQLRSQEVHGLRGMAERARIAGGQCAIESVPGSGTSVVVDLPFLARG
jgi:signal transduction histidine kinase